MICLAQIATSEGGADEDPAAEKRRRQQLVVKMLQMRKELRKSESIIEAAPTTACT